MPVQDSIREQHEAMRVDWPEAERGRWRIERRTVTEEEAKLGRLRAAFGDRRFTPAGTYTGLLRGQTVVMSDVPDEMRDHWEVYHEAGRRGGRCLVHGLGLGMVTKALLTLPQIEHVDVVEVEEDVIALVGPHLVARFGEERLMIHHGDAFTHEWPRGVRWDVAWHDVWDTLCVDNLSDEECAQPGTYARLNRRFARRADWQGAWGQDWLRAQRERGWC